MGEILNRLEKVKERYSEILKEELQSFDDSAEERAIILRKKISDARNDVSCGKCGACCRLAVSPDSPNELMKKAKNGDVFAEEFLNTFSLYEDLSEPEKLYPDYVKTIKSLGETLYFYHCKLVTDDNLCPKYEDRPQICKNFPENPLEIYPVSCEYKRWRDTILDDMLRLKAIVDILDLEKEN